MKFSTPRLRAGEHQTFRVRTLFATVISCHITAEQLFINLIIESCQRRCDLFAVVIVVFFVHRMMSKHCQTFDGRLPIVFETVRKEHSGYYFFFILMNFRIKNYSVKLI